MQEHEYIHTHFSNKRTFTLLLGTFLMLEQIAKGHLLFNSELLSKVLHSCKSVPTCFKNQNCKYAFVHFQHSTLVYSHFPK